jgi:dGTPase
MRTAFQRDRDRIVHSAAFRRLKYKTQVFVYHEGDYYRTRLTHSLEVAQIARTLARALGANEDLTETLALAHDLGHPPFGHAGEQALDKAMEGYGGFDHNAQALRVLTSLEQRYAEFDGLNLTWETLEGVAKHNGPLTGALAKSAKPVPEAIAEYVAGHDLELDTHAGLEAQIAALSDDIAYRNHDLDDGLRAGLFPLADVEEVALIGPLIAKLRKRYPRIENSRLIHESIRRLIDRMVSDSLAETRARLDKAGAGTPCELRRLGRPVVAFSASLRKQDESLKSFLFERMYRHYRVNRTTAKARRVVREIFDLYIGQPDCLPGEWRKLAGDPQTQTTARVVCDYIAGMTDRYALEEHRRLFDIYLHSQP